MINKMNYAIGIDLGTTYSCAGVWRNGRIEIITNQMGERTVPSIVAFTETKRLIGNEAKNQMTKNYKNTVYDAKRLIGRNFSNEIVQKDMKLWPFTVKEDNKDRPLICVEYKKEKKEFYPEQISAMILEKLKNNAETYLGQEVKDAVIAVPAYFNNLQRQATIDAGRIAGLNVIKTINEPTAAAIAYGLEQKNNEKKNICVFDLGGGTFDVTILEVDNKKFTVKAIGGNSHLGGQDFDNLLVEYCMNLFKKNTDIDISNNQKALRRLKIACEEAKKELSISVDSHIEISSLTPDEDFVFDLTQIDINNICKSLFNQCIDALKNTIKESGLTKNDITDVVLIGGSTRIPQIQNLISEFFENKKKLLKTINADEAVAYGAAIEAALNNEGQDDNLETLVLVDVCPLSLGTDVIGGLMSVIIKRNTPLPCEKSNNYVTVKDNQTVIGFDVYEGEREFVKDNILLEKYSICNIKKAPRGKSSITVTFSIDQKFSLLKVTAKEVNDDNNSVYHEIKKGIRDEEEIEKMIEEANKMKNDDLERRKKVEKINELEEILYNIQNENNPNYIYHKDIIDNKVKEIRTWIEKNNDEKIEEYQKKINEINNFKNTLI